MKHIDYIIVGCGLAGVAFCEQLQKAGKLFVVFDDGSQKSSSVAAGIYNPVVLKRFTKVWKAQEQLDLAMTHYKELEHLLHVKLNHKIAVLRKFANIEEQNEWYVASDQPVLSDFIQPEIIKNESKNINAPFGFGKVLHSGRIDTKTLIASYRDYLKTNTLLEESRFEHGSLKISDELISYNDYTAKQIVFTEGFGLTENTFFPSIPIVGLKGEMLIIKAPKLQLGFIIKSSVFVVPLGNDEYWVGATYEHHDKTQNISAEAKKQLIDKLKTVITCDFEVIQQFAGVRPTTKDRRPLVGNHPDYQNVYVLNGMGTRGVMVSPYISKQLFNHIEYSNILDAEIDIKRFKAFR